MRLFLTISLRCANGLQRWSLSNLLTYKQIFTSGSDLLPKSAQFVSNCLCVLHFQIFSRFKFSLDFEILETLSIIFNYHLFLRQPVFLTARSARAISRSADHVASVPHDWRGTLLCVNGSRSSAEFISWLYTFVLAHNKLPLIHLQRMLLPRHTGMWLARRLNSWRGLWRLKRLILFFHNLGYCPFYFNIITNRPRQLSFSLCLWKRKLWLSFLLLLFFSISSRLLWFSCFRQCLLFSVFLLVMKSCFFWVNLFLIIAALQKLINFLLITLSIQFSFVFIWWS